MLTFESLPNEIFVELFDYLNTFELFTIFDRFNLRFHQLIRQIPLRVDLQRVRKTTFDQFCTLLQTNPTVKTSSAFLGAVPIRRRAVKIDLFPLALLPRRVHSSAIVDIRSSRTAECGEDQSQAASPLRPATRFRLLHVFVFKTRRKRHPRFSSHDQSATAIPPIVTIPEHQQHYHASDHFSVALSINWPINSSNARRC